jgi:hypothetical protein
MATSFCRFDALGAAPFLSDLSDSPHLSAGSSRAAP